MQPSEYFILVLFIVLGVFSITASVLNLDWYFQTDGAGYLSNGLVATAHASFISFWELV